MLQQFVERPFDRLLRHHRIDGTGQIGSLENVDQEEYPFLRDIVEQDNLLGRCLTFATGSATVDDFPHGKIPLGLIDGHGRRGADFAKERIQSGLFFRSEIPNQEFRLTLHATATP